ncbi:MAG: DUF4412 domain-containing protein [Bacteroidota bacterium]
MKFHLISENMRKLVLPVLMISLVLAPGGVCAQSLKSVIRKTVVEPARVANDIAEEKAEEKAEEEAEKQITKAIMEGYGIEENAKFDSEYKFDAWFQMQVTEYKKNGKVDTQGVYDNYVSKSTRDYGMEFSDEEARSTIIYDSDRFAMIILSDDDGEKTGFATRFDPETLEGAEEEETPVSNDLNAYKTGNTKKILGYTCDKYLIDDEDAEVHMWVSEQLGKEISKEMLSNPNAFGNSFQYSKSVNGMTLEYELIDKNDGDKTEMLVTNLDLNRNHSISTEGYNILSMNQQE